MEVPQFGFVWSQATVTTGQQTSAGGGVQQGGGRWSRGAGGTAGTALFGARGDAAAAAARTPRHTALTHQGQGSRRGALGVGRGCAGGTQRAGGGVAERDAAAPRQPLQALAADVMVLLPVFVLAEGAAVASGVAAAARLAGFPPAVPAALVGQQRQQINNNFLCVGKSTTK